MRTVLLIAFHFPPCAMSSGIQRVQAFARHLPEHGWRTHVLTVTPRVYERVSPGSETAIEGELPVHRTGALDAARDLAIGGRYWSRTTIPDRWWTWRYTAVPAARRLIAEHRIDAVWTTYPIATAHSIGARVARATGIPWIADFRDPMVERLESTGEEFPRDPALRAARLRIERSAVEDAASLVFCTDGARDIVHRRYGVPEARGHVIPNGYDERAFGDAEALGAARAGARRVILHSGTVYPGPDRDPTALFEAVAALHARGTITPDSLEIRLRDPSNAGHFTQLAERCGIAPYVSILPPLPYREALAEMLHADALLLLQGYPSNPAIPAKLYEYLRAGRPILGLVHPDGETARTLRTVGVDTCCPLDDRAAIEGLVARWLQSADGLLSTVPARTTISRYSRRELTGNLGRILDDAVARGGAR